jgi:hypothetical protein
MHRCDNVVYGFIRRSPYWSFQSWSDARRAKLKATALIQVLEADHRARKIENGETIEVFIS